MREILKVKPWLSVGVSVAALTLAGCGGGGAESQVAAGTDLPLDSSAQTDTDISATPTMQIEAMVAQPLAQLAPTAFYIDPAAGSDTADGSLNKPWRTLGRLKSLALKPGQSLYLRCGARFRETLTLTSFHLPANTVVAGYGDCAGKPAELTGSDDFSGSWSKSGSVWSRSVPAGTPKIARLFIDGTAQRVAQWPNYGGIGAEYGKADASSPASLNKLVLTAADRLALTGRTLVGATAKVRSEPWAIESLTISAWNQSSGTLTFGANAVNTMEGGDGYVLQDQLWMLDAAGEFFHDTVANKIYVIPAVAPPGGDLNKAVVEGSVRDVLLTVNGVPGVVLQNLSFSRARVRALSIEESMGAVLSNLTVNGNAGVGIRVIAKGTPGTGKVGASITASTFSDNWVAGIDASGAAGVVVSGNVITDTGTIANAGASNAAVVVGDGGIISVNRVQRTAYHGLRFSGASDSKVNGNMVTDYCMRLSDCGGIYTWNGATKPARTTGMSSTVSQNRLASAWSNVEGAVGGGSGLVAGVYLDNFSTNVTVSNNTVAASSIGLHLHNGSVNTVRDNQFWLATRAALSVSMDMTGTTDWLTGNVFTRNMLVPARKATGSYPALPSFGGGLAVQFRDTVSGVGAITSGANSFTANNIVLLNGKSASIASVANASTTTQYSAASWLRLNSAELPVQSGISFALYQATLGSELLNNGGFEGALTPWAAWFAGGSGSGSLSLTSGMSGCVNTCALFSVGGGTDSLMSVTFNMVAGQLHLITYNATLGGDAVLGAPYIARSASPYTNIVDSRGFASPTVLNSAAGDVIGYEAFFAPAAADTSRVNLKVNTAQVNVAFDNASLRPVSGYTVSTVSDYATSVHAEPTAQLTVDCTNLGWPVGCTAMDVNGTAVALPTTVPAGTSALLFRANSPWRR